MPDNYRITAERMSDSSIRLHSNGQYHNACYLAGYVGECYLKLLVNLALTRPGGARAYNHSLTAMNTDLVPLMSGTASYAAYIMDMRIDCPKMLSWNPNLRYDDSSIWNGGKSTDFQIEQSRCISKVAAMVINSII